MTHPKLMSAKRRVTCERILNDNARKTNVRNWQIAKMDMGWNEIEEKLCLNK